MKNQVIFLSVFFLACFSPISAQTTPTTWTVDDDLADFPEARFTHPQDAVNAASPGDTIKVYPGIYGTREVPDIKSPLWIFPNDFLAPALIVYKDGLTIEAVDPDPAKTVIQSTHYDRSSPLAIQWSTGGVWNAAENKYTGAGVNPVTDTAPNTIAVIASNVVIRGFTVRCPWERWGTAGVMIGGLYAGYGGNGEALGSGNNTVEDCVFQEAWHAVYIWHSSGNWIVHNTVKALSDNTDHLAGISVCDGYDDAQIALDFPSEGNVIANNILANKGIAVGDYGPWTRASYADTVVCCNTATMLSVICSNGPMLAGCNVTSGNFLRLNAQNAMEIRGVTYTGDTAISGAGLANVNLGASLDFEGTGGNDVEVIFNVGGKDYEARTTSGNASTTAKLAPGAYTITTRVELSDCCSFTDIDSLTIRQSAITVGVDIKPGGFPNSIKLKEKGVLPVAILGSRNLDVTQISFSSLRIGLVVAPLSRNRYGLEDVNSDGFVDMVVHFSMEELTGKGALDSGSTQLTITGALKDGTSITGTDSVRIIP